MREVVAVVEVPKECLDAWPERPRRLQPGRGLADRPLAAARETGGIHLRLDHHRPQLRQLHHPVGIPRSGGAPL